MCLLPRAATAKSLQTWWLKLVAGMSSLSVLRAGRLKSRCGRGGSFRLVRGESVSGLCQLLVVAGDARRSLARGYTGSVSASVFTWSSLLQTVWVFSFCVSDENTCLWV